MQGAVPFKWEEQPGKPKSKPWRSRRQSSRVSEVEEFSDSGTGSGSASERGNPVSGLSLKELLASDRKIHFLAPPPGFSPKIQNMSGSSGCSASGSSSTSPTDDLSSSSAASHSRSRSVTLLDLISQQDKAPNTLEQLFKQDPSGNYLEQSNSKMNMAAATQQAQAQHKQQIGINSGGAGARRSSYMPYKQGLLSIFCMSPLDTSHLPVVSPRMSGAHARPRHFYR